MQKQTWVLGNKNLCVKHLFFGKKRPEIFLQSLALRKLRGISRGSSAGARLFPSHSVPCRGITAWVCTHKTKDSGNNISHPLPFHYIWGWFVATFTLFHWKEFEYTRQETLVQLSSVSRLFLVGVRRRMNIILDWIISRPQTFVDALITPFLEQKGINIPVLQWFVPSRSCLDTLSKQTEPKLFCRGCPIVWIQSLGEYGLNIDTFFLSYDFQILFYSFFFSLLYCKYGVY